MGELYKRIEEMCRRQGTNVTALCKKAGVGRATLSELNAGRTKGLKLETAAKLAQALGVTVDALLGTAENSSATQQGRLPDNCVPVRPPTGNVPILGVIPAGDPVLANEDVEGYAPVDVSDPENCFWLRVRGDSMVGAGIQSGDLVLLRRQNFASDGQIVACRLNTDEATLKRFKRQGDTVLLLPENPRHEPRIVSARDFEAGYASILGVAIEIRRQL